MAGTVIPGSADGRGGECQRTKNNLVCIVKRRQAAACEFAAHVDSRRRSNCERPLQASTSNVSVIQLLPRSTSATSKAVGSERSRNAGAGEWCALSSASFTVICSNPSSAGAAAVPPPGVLASRSRRQAALAMRAPSQCAHRPLDGPPR